MEIITASASRNEPISFLSPLKLIPVFPPTAASTADSRVVGTLMKWMPRLNVAAAKPPMSVVNQGMPAMPMWMPQVICALRSSNVE